MALSVTPWRPNDPSGLISALTGGIQTGEALRARAAQQMQLAQAALAQQEKQRIAQEKAQQDMAMELLQEQRLEKAMNLSDGYRRAKEARLKAESAPYKSTYGGASSTPSIPATDPASALTAGYANGDASVFSLVPDGKGGMVDDPHDILDAGVKGFSAKKGAWGHNIKDPSLMGVAITPAELKAAGINPNDRDAVAAHQVEAITPSGHRALVDIVDKNGTAGRADFTYAAYKALGGPDERNGGLIKGIKYRIIPRGGGEVAGGAPSIPATDPAAALVDPPADPLAELAANLERAGVPTKQAQTILGQTASRLATQQAKSGPAGSAPFADQIAAEGFAYDKEKKLYTREDGSEWNLGRSAAGKLVIKPAPIPRPELRSDNLGNVYRVTADNEKELVIPAKTKMPPKEKEQFMKDVKKAADAESALRLTAEDTEETSWFGRTLEAVGARSKKGEAEKKALDKANASLRNWKRAYPDIDVEIVDPESIAKKATAPKKEDPEKAASINAAKAALQKRPDARAAIIARLEENGITDHGL